MAILPAFFHHDGTMNTRDTRINQLKCFVPFVFPRGTVMKG